MAIPWYFIEKVIEFCGVDEKITKSSGGKTNRAEQNKQTNKQTKTSVQLHLRCTVKVKEEEKG